MAPRAGAPGAANTRPPAAVFSLGLQTNLGGGGGDRARPHSFLAGREAVAFGRSSGARGQPRPSRAGFFLPAGSRAAPGARAARASCPERRRKPGTLSRSRAPSVRGPSARASFVRSASAGRGLSGAAERFREARPCPTPRERKFPLPPLSCDSSTLPPQQVGRVRVLSVWVA